MSQGYQTIAASDDIATNTTKLITNLAALLSWHVGPSAPSYAVAGTVWIDNTTATAWLFKLYDGTDWITLPWSVNTTANTALLAAVTASGILNMGGFRIENMGVATASGHAATKGQVDGKVLVSTPTVAGFFATVQRPLFTAPANCTIHKIWLLSSAATAGSDGTHNYTFQARNVGTGGAGTTDLLSAAKTTNGAEIGVYAAYDLGADQNLSMAEGESLQLRVTRNGTPTDLSAALIVAIVQYKVATA